MTRLQATMSTLYIDRQGTELQWREGAIELRLAEQPVRRVPGALLERVVLRSDTIVHSSALAAMTDAGIAVVAFGGRGGQRVAHLLGVHARDCRARIAQCQRLTDTEWIGLWCRTIVRRRLRGQYLLLDQAMQTRPDLRKPLHDARGTLERLLERLPKIGNRDEIRGLEGAGAAAFFRAYIRLFPDSAQFSARRRRPPPDPVNACLSLGYTLLHSRAVQACWTVGLDPMVGYLHLPVAGRASLACDLVEPWRARIEAWVWRCWQERILRPEHFGRDGAGACLLGKAGRERFYADIHPVLGKCQKGLTRSARQLAIALAGRAAGIDGDADWEAGEIAP